MSLPGSNSHGFLLRSIDALNQYRRFHIPLLLAIAVLTRVEVFFDFDSVILGWRQADNASIALNYVEGGMDFLYPQVYWGGSGPGYVEMEFPLLPYLTALLYMLFGVRDGLAVLFPFLMGVGTVLVVYLLARRIYDSATGVGAGLFIAASPMLSFFSQTFVGETGILFFSVLGIYALVRWADEEKPGYYILGGVSIALAILLKLTVLYIGFPILFLVRTKYGSGIWKEAKVWLLAGIILIPVVLWYYHAHTMYQEYGNTFGILTGGYNKFAGVDLLTSTSFYTLIGGRVFFYVLTPFVAGSLVYALLARQPNRTAYVLHTWLAGLIVYVFVVAEGNKDMNYYQLPFLPPATVLASHGFLALIRRLGSIPRIIASDRTQVYMMNLLVILFVVNTVGSGMLFSSRGDVNRRQREEENREIGKLVGTITEHGSFIVVATSYGSEKSPERIDTPPEIFYFSDRRGWYQAISWLTVESVDRLAGEGGRYVVIPGEDAGKFRSGNPLYERLSTKYVRVLDEEKCLVFDLKGVKSEGVDAHH